MLDSNGKEVKIGDYIKFRFDTRMHNEWDWCKLIRIEKRGPIFRDVHDFEFRFINRSPELVIIKINEEEAILMRLKGI
jgi:hypothetical protein